MSRKFFKFLNILLIRWFIGKLWYKVFFIEIIFFILSFLILFIRVLYGRGLGIGIF